MVWGELHPDVRQHLRANLRPGGKTHNMTSAVRAKTQRNAEIPKTQRGTCLALCAHHCAAVIFLIAFHVVGDLEMGFDCVNSGCQLHSSVCSDVYILIKLLFNHHFFFASNKVLNLVSFLDY